MGHPLRGDFAWPRSLVFLLIRGASGLRRLWQAARQEVQQDRWDYYLLATFDVLDRKRFTDEVWLDLRGDYVSLLASDFGDRDDDSAQAEAGVGSES